MKPWLCIPMALVIASTPAASLAQQAQKEALPATRQSGQGASGVQEGVKLHGDWEIIVRNPDGTVVRSANFKNSLVDSGKTALANLLLGLGVQTVFVHFNPPDPSDAVSYNPTLGLNRPGFAVCGTLPIGSEGCVVQTANAANNANTGWHQDGVNVFNQLNQGATVAPGAPGAGALVLSGSFTATAAGVSQIRLVKTVLVWGQGSGFRNDFTLARLPVPVSVSQGQIVQFTYTLSFS